MFAKSSALLAALFLTGCTATSVSEPQTLGGGRADIVRFSQQCEKWDDWDKPAEPFRIYGSTYYVGTCGISAILITSEEGHILIDSGTEAGARIVLENIRKLGFDPRDISYLLYSHEHFDHVGGHHVILDQADPEVVATKESMRVFTTGLDNPDDPQAGLHEPMKPVAVDRLASELGVFRVGSEAVVALDTPGHSPGGMSWTWGYCESSAACTIIAYADSLSPISRDGYKFSDHPDYVARYRAGIATIRDLDCDILLTPHPSHSRMIERAATGTFEGGMTCAQYADAKTEALDARLAKETAQ